jgi:hypothetical protein
MAPLRLPLPRPPTQPALHYKPHNAPLLSALAARDRAMRVGGLGRRAVGIRSPCPLRRAALREVMSRENESCEHPPSACWVPWGYFTASFGYSAEGGN